jgi:hypothetical protein
MNLMQGFGLRVVPLVSVALLSLAGLLAGLPAQADTVKARFDVLPKGGDRATSAGLCTFSQRQGFVSIQLKNGQSFELSPQVDKPNTYLDVNGSRRLANLRIVARSTSADWPSSQSSSTGIQPRTSE